MVPIKVRLDNDDHYDGQNSKEYIIVHDTGNKTDSDEGNANYFCTGTRDASSNAFADDDSITTVVLDTDASFNCGDGGNRYGIGNKNTISIEMCRVNGVVTAKTEANALDWIKLKMIEHNIPLEKVVRHYDASRKNCPASFNLDGQWTRWFEFKAKLAIMVNPVAPSSGEIYRVRKAWSDSASQIGAFTEMTNVIICVNAHPGYEAYSSNGIQVYPVAAPVILAYANLVNSTSRLQNVLNAMGITDATGHRLDADGRMGILTKQALAKVMIIRGNKNALVGWIQEQLGISVDSDYGDLPWHGTYDAIKSFQAKHGLVVDAKPGIITILALI